MAEEKPKAPIAQPTQGPTVEETRVTQDTAARKPTKLPLRIRQMIRKV